MACLPVSPRARNRDAKVARYHYLCKQNSAQNFGLKNWQEAETRNTCTRYREKRMIAAGFAGIAFHSETRLAKFPRFVAGFVARYWQVQYMATGSRRPDPIQSFEGIRRFIWKVLLIVR